MSGGGTGRGPGSPRRMYHYTDRDGYNGIRSQVDWCFKAAQPPPRDHPFGAYFTTLGPETARAKLAQLFIPNEKREYVFVFEDAGDLTPLRGGRGQYVLYSPADYVVGCPRQIDHGKAIDVGARRRGSGGRVP